MEIKGKVTVTINGLHTVDVHNLRWEELPPPPPPLDFGPVEVTFEVTPTRAWRRQFFHWDRLWRRFRYPGRKWLMAHRRNQ